MARPAYKAPDGRLTLRDAAAQSGISYHVAYTRITDPQFPIPHKRDGTIYTIAVEDLGMLVRDRGEPKDKRIAIQCRISPELNKAFERVAGDMAVSSWLIELGKQAAGVATEEPAAAAPLARGKRTRAS